MTKILITRQLFPTLLEKIRHWANDSMYQLAWWNQPTPMPRPLLKQELALATGVLCTLSDILDQALLAKETSPHLRVISTMSVGVNHLDLATAQERGLIVGHTPDVLTRACADFSLALLLALTRRVVEANARARAGQWPQWRPDFLLGHSMRAKTLGILGDGRIGREFARQAQSALEMKIIFLSRGPKLYSELAQCQVVSCHLPLTVKTRHLIDQKFFQAMAPGSFLLNTARGEIVVTQALLEALESEHLAGAALDVTEPEPLGPEHRLYQFPNVIITPHIASAETETRLQMAELAWLNLKNGLEGRAVVSPKP